MARVELVRRSTLVALLLALVPLVPARAFAQTSITADALCAMLPPSFASEEKFGPRPADKSQFACSRRYADGPSLSVKLYDTPEAAKEPTKLRNERGEKATTNLGEAGREVLIPGDEGPNPRVRAIVLTAARGCWGFGGSSGQGDPVYSQTGVIVALPPGNSGVDANRVRTEVAKIDTAIQKLPACPSSQPANGCRPNGTVLDHNRTPVPDIEVVLRAGSAAPVKTFTDATGHYEFSLPTAKEGFDAATQKMKVEVVSRDGAHGDKPHFEIYSGPDVAVVRSDDFLAKDDCQRDFHFDALPAKYGTNLLSFQHWPGLVSIFMSLRASWALADELGHTMSYGLPLRVYAWCRVGTTGAPRTCPDRVDGAHYDSEDGQKPPRPYIAMEDGASRPDKAPGTAAHEFGHAFLRDALGEQVARSDNVNHGGYYVNKNTNDAWSEAWATFFEVMVQKRILKLPAAQVTASHGDMEQDLKAWAAEGKLEEFALVGVLVDVEDGKSDYPEYAPSATSLIAVTVNRDRGFVRADGLPGPVGRPYELTFRDKDLNQVETRPGRVRAGPDGKFFLAMPIPKELMTRGGPQFASVDAQFLSASSIDDDPVDGELAAIWGKIKSFRGSTPGGHIADATELMAALKSLYGGDRDGDKQDDVEEIFVKHGFFADTAGGRSNQQRDADEAPGLTSHIGPPGETVDPRRSPSPIPAMQAHVGGSDEDQVLVQVSVDAPNQLSSYGYLATPDADGYIPVTPPPAGKSGVVSMLRLPLSGEPIAIGEISLDELWTHVEADSDKSFMDFASAQAAPAGQVDGDGGAPVGIILLLVAAAGVGAYVIRSRGRPQPLPASSGPAVGGTEPYAASSTRQWATHHVPASGAWAWTAPDPLAAPTTSLDPWLEVRLIEFRADGWAHIECSNSWTAWVDGRVLQPLDAEGPRG